MGTHPIFESDFDCLTDYCEMAMAMQTKFKLKLPPEVNRILYVRNLPYKITTEELYDIFGNFGALRQVRIGVTPETKGTAYVIYEIFMMQKMLATIFPVSTCVTGTWLYFTTTQPALSKNSKPRKKKPSWPRFEKEWVSRNENFFDLSLFTSL